MTAPAAELHFSHTWDKPHLSCFARVQRAQIWNKLYSPFVLKPSSHSHPSGYGKATPCLGRGTFDCSSGSRGRRGAGGCQEDTGTSPSHASLSVTAMWWMKVELLVGKITKAFRVLGQVRRALHGPGRLGTAKERATDTAMCYVYSSLGDINQDTTVPNGKSMRKYF